MTQGSLTLLPTMKLPFELEAENLGNESNATFPVPMDQAKPDLMYSPVFLPASLMIPELPVREIPCRVMSRSVLSGAARADVCLRPELCFPGKANLPKGKAVMDAKGITKPMDSNNTRFRCDLHDFLILVLPPFLSFDSFCTE
jgi:hypothetical protein